MWEQAPGGSVIRAQTSYPTGRGSLDATVNGGWLLGAKGETVLTRRLDPLSQGAPSCLEGSDPSTAAGSSATGRGVRGARPSTERVSITS